MNFFKGQVVARRRTVLFAACYLAATLLMVPLVYVVLLSVAVPIRATSNFFRELYDFRDTFTAVPHPGWWDAQLFFKTAVVTMVLMLAGTIHRLWQVSKGGYVIALMLGGDRIDPDTDDPLYKRLLHVTEEMAVATGLPVPEVYLLRSERGINAFAAGLTVDDAAIGATRGCLEVLTRDELQTLVAHEFSHILHGDTRLNTVLAGLLHGLSYPGMLCGRYARGALMRGDPALRVKALFLFVVLGFITLPLLVVMQVGVAFAELIKRTVTRQRVFLGDAAAVQFTRNPDALASALKKVGGRGSGSCVFHVAAEEASHFFFASPLRKCVMSSPGFSAHPPPVERIRRIDPRFSGEMETTTIQRGKPQEAPSASIPQAARRPALSTDTATALTESIGTLRPEHLATAAALLSAIPPQLATALRQPGSARGVIYALLLSCEQAPRRVQLERLRTSTAPGVMAETQKAMLALGHMQGAHRLPMASLAVRTLRGLSAADYHRFRENVEVLIAADHAVNLFEFALQRMIFRHLSPTFDPHSHRPQTVRYHALEPLLPACRDLLSGLARAGTYDGLDQEQAYRQAMAMLIGEGGAIPDMPTMNGHAMEAIGAALDQLAQASMPVKKRVMEACIGCVAADGHTTVQEAEMLQVTADSLGIPMPPGTLDSFSVSE